MSNNVIGVRITGDGKELEAALERGGRQVRGFGEQVEKTKDPVNALAQGLRSAFLGSSIAVGIITIKNLVADATAAIVQAQIEVDRLRNGLNFAVGREKSAGELLFIRQTVQQLGLEFVSTAGQYTKLAAAARGTNLEGKATRDIFTSIAQASTVMGLGVEQTEGALLAVTQMISKGKVQAEELRGQLGERLPGAFQIAARAMGVTTAELDKMLETGQVLAVDFLPKFAQQLSMEVAPEVGAASKSMQASINRLSNAWTNLKQNMAQSGASEGAGWIARAFGSDLQAMSEAMERARLSGGGFFRQWNDGLGMLIGRAAGLQYVNRDFMTLEQQVKDSTATIAALDARWAQFGQLSLADRSARANAVRDLARAMAQLNAAAGPQLTGGSDIRVERLGRDESQRQAQAAKDKAFLDRIRASNAGKSASFDSDLKALSEIRDRGGFSSDNEYRSIVEGLIKREGGGAKGGGSANAGAAALASLRGRVDAERENLAALRESGIEADKLNAGQKLALQLQEQLATKLDAKTRAAKLAELAAANELGAFLYAQEKMKDAIRLDQERTKAYQELYAQQVRAQEEIAQAEVEASKAREQGREAVSNFVTAVQEQNDYVALEISLLGQSEARRKDALDQYQIELDLKRRIAEIDRNAGFDEAQREEERAKVRAAAKKDLEGRRSLSSAIAERQRDPYAGARDGVNQYLETVRNVADSTKSMMVNAFQGMEDALVSFVRTGKLDFKSLANSIISDFVRIQVRQSITGPLAQSAAGGSGGFLGGLFGDVFNGVLSLLPKFDTGIDSVPYDMPAIIHKGERVVPAAQNRAGWGGFSPSTSIVVQGGNTAEIYANVSRALDARDREWSERLKAVGVF